MIEYHRESQEKSIENLTRENEAFQWDMQNTRVLAEEAQKCITKNEAEERQSLTQEKAQICRDTKTGVLLHLKAVLDYMQFNQRILNQELNKLKAINEEKLNKSRSSRGSRRIREAAAMEGRSSISIKINQQEQSISKGDRNNNCESGGSSSNDQRRDQETDTAPANQACENRNSEMAATTGTDDEPNNQTEESQFHKSDDSRNQQQGTKEDRKSVV